MSEKLSGIPQKIRFGVLSPSQTNVSSSLLEVKHVAHFEIQIDFIFTSETRCCSFFDPQKDIDNSHGLTKNHLGISHIKTGTLSKIGSKSTETPLT